MDDFWDTYLYDIPDAIAKPIDRYLDEIQSRENEKMDAKYLIKNSSIGDMSLEDIERESIERTLKFFNDNRRASAKSLGISERRLSRKINQYEQDTKNVK
jgi:DNA-binding NtrC family response regulator